MMHGLILAGALLCPASAEACNRPVVRIATAPVRAVVKAKPVRRIVKLPVKAMKRVCKGKCR